MIMNQLYDTKCHEKFLMCNFKTNAHTCTHTHTETNTHTHTDKHTYTYINAYAHTQIINY